MAAAPAGRAVMFPFEQGQEVATLAAYGRPAPTTRGDQMSDGRATMYRSFDQAAQVIAGVSAAQLQRPTPCTEFDVRALLDHLVYVGRKVAALAHGEPIPEQAATEGWGKAFDEARHEVFAGWADDSLLGSTIDVGWAQFSGAQVVEIYTMEVVAHTWDLARATDQLGALDPALAEAALAVGHWVLPAEPRGGMIPFGPVIEVSPEAPPYHRLAGWLGRLPA
jgi:uncharacterized protein (TIGR03086 family)